MLFRKFYFIYYSLNSRPNSVCLLRRIDELKKRRLSLRYDLSKYLSVSHNKDYGNENKIRKFFLMIYEENQ